MFNETADVQLNLQVNRSGEEIVPMILNRHGPIKTTAEIIQFGRYVD